MSEACRRRILGRWSVVIRIENDCCGCAVPAYPCLGNYCPLRHTEHYYCDCCGNETDKLYKFKGKEICGECLEEFMDEMSEGGGLS